MPTTDIPAVKMSRGSGRSAKEQEFTRPYLATSLRIIFRCYSSGSLSSSAKCLAVKGLCLCGATRHFEEMTKWGGSGPSR
jgi:hypothetical protein